jgi:hypothetical protein
VVGQRLEGVASQGRKPHHCSVPFTKQMLQRHHQPPASHVYSEGHWALEEWAWPSRGDQKTLDASAWSGQELSCSP